MTRPQEPEPDTPEPIPPIDVPPDPIEEPKDPPPMRAMTTPRRRVRLIMH